MLGKNRYWQLVVTVSTLASAPDRANQALVEFMNWYRGLPSSVAKSWCPRLKQHFQAFNVTIGAPGSHFLQELQVICVQQLWTERGGRTLLNGLMQ